MILTVKRTREDIITKLDTVEQVKPGTFIQPIEKLRRKEDDIEPTPRSARSNEHIMKYLEMQSVANKEQMEFFLKFQQRHDANLKKTMASTVEYLRRLELIDRE